MAENDNLPLDTSVFVKQITNVCDKAKSTSSSSNIRNHNSSTSNHSLHKMMSSGSTDRAGASSRCSLFSGKGVRRHVALLHNSASYESRATSGSRHGGGNGGGTTGRAGYSRSLDDAAVSRHTAWRQQHQLSSRQGTGSDDPDEDSELRNASMESLYSSSDRDSDVEAMSNTYYEHTSTRRARLSRQREHRELRRPLLRQALLGSSTGLGPASDGECGYPHGYCCSSSHRSSVATLGATILAEHCLPCTASMGDLDKLDTDAPPGSEGDPHTDSAARQIPAAAKRRSISMLNLTPPGRAAYYVPDSALPDASPIRPPSSEMFLDDTLLGGNLADILFSVEALWPKKL